MNHYLYLLTFPDNMLYVGARSTVIAPELDAMYLGSGTRLPERSRHSCKKVILNTFATRKALIEAEIDYIVKNNCVESATYYNARKATYDRHGEIGKPVNAGRTKESHEYIREASIKNSAYTGKDRTPAQLAHDERMRGVATGPNKAKGREGIYTYMFQPWYYITPNGEYVEVLNETKKDYAPKLGFTQRQLGHRFHYTNMHKKGKRHPFTGWTFGDLCSKPTDIV